MFKFKELHQQAQVKAIVNLNVCIYTIYTLRRAIHCSTIWRSEMRPCLKIFYVVCRFFIDRDGALFKYILAYARYGKVKLRADSAIREEIAEEARYFEVKSDHPLNAACCHSSIAH